LIPGRTSRLVYGLAALDDRGRVADRVVLRALGWSAGLRLAIEETGGALTVRTDPHGNHQVTGQGHLRLPAPLRHRYSLAPRGPCAASRRSRPIPPHHLPTRSARPRSLQAVSRHDYVINIRPRFGLAEHPGLFVTERGGRLQPREIEDRFAEYRHALELPKVLVPHCLRHIVPA
jgi:hypothetical protein